MNNFNKYSEYYELLYKDKDYSGEVRYIEELIESHTNIKPESILDLGCGTGRHASIFTQKDYKVTGVDKSATMLQIARKNYPNIEFVEADVTKVNLNQQFDVVVSLFHVASYMIYNFQFEAYLQTAYNHLKQNGLFIFDFWYGPAVLSDPPETRIKRLGNNNMKITRIAEPSMNPNTNIVDVNYEIVIEAPYQSTIERIKELHQMRYWFLPELQFLLDKHNLSCISAFKWLEFRNLDFDSWYGVIVCKKIL